MWLFTNFGFFSVVQKPGDTDLTIRSRVRSDLDTLRERYLPSMGATKEGGGTDYPFRAKAAHAAVAEAMSKMVKDIHYDNFKESVEEEQGPREGTDLRAGMVNADEVGGERGMGNRGPIMTKAMAFGGVVIDTNGRVLLRKPAGEFDGYVWTFAQGRPKPGQTAEDAALCEVEEETGWVCQIICRIPGSFEGGTTANEYFLMRPLKDTGHFDSETQEIVWVRPSEAKDLIKMTRNTTGRKRDLAVLEAAMAVKALK